MCPSRPLNAESEPFRRFKDVLGSWPGELDRWYEFSAERQRGRARAWLADAGYYVRKGLPSLLTRWDSGDAPGSRACCLGDQVAVADRAAVSR